MPLAYTPTVRPAILFLDDVLSLPVSDRSCHPLATAFPALPEQSLLFLPPYLPDPSAPEAWTPSSHIFQALLL